MDTVPNGVLYPLAVLGSLLVAKYTFDFARLCFDYVRPGVPLTKFGAGKGAWAVVTGASDGIGRVFSLELARKGFNIVLVARNQERLDTVADEITSKYPSIKTQTHLIDVNDRANNKPSYEALEKLVQGLTVGVLINNVGRSHDHPDYFPDFSTAEMEAIIDVNLHGTLTITKIVLPGMLERKNGLVLTIGSFAGAVPCPLLSVYSGAKAGLIAWSQAIAEECAAKGVVVNLVNTYFVTTKLSKIRRPTFFIPRVEPYVKSVLSHINRRCGATIHPYVSTPYYSQALYHFFLDHFGWMSLFLSVNRKQRLVARKKWYKKYGVEDLREGEKSKKQ